MRPNLYRGQAPAKGIMVLEQRIPLRRSVAVDGKETWVADPRGYWNGQRHAGYNNARRAAIKELGGIRQFKKLRNQLNFGVNVYG